MMLKLIVNADDFGLSETVNEGILKAHEAGVLTSASIMANGAAFEHAVSICRRIPSLDVGIHLTLVEEEPVVKANQVRSLVDATGRLHRSAATFTRRYFAGKIRLQELQCELEAQICKVMSSGIAVSHLDAHQHLHMLPQVLEITTKLAKKYGIEAIRFPREAIRSYMFKGEGAVRRLLQLLVLTTFCHLGKNMTAVRTDHFLGFFFGGKLNKDSLHQLIKSLPTNGSCELMCHPGCEDTMTRYAHWRYHWSSELAALTDSETAELLRQSGVTLISYRQLVQAGAHDTAATKQNDLATRPQWNA